MSPSSQDLEKARSASEASQKPAENLAHSATHGTYYSIDDVNSLSEAHRAYLQQRHGTLELDPIPGFGDADPFNWTLRKVRITDTWSSRLHTLT